MNANVNSTDAIAEQLKREGKELDARQAALVKREIALQSKEESYAAREAAAVDTTTQNKQSTKPKSIETSVGFGYDPLKILFQAQVARDQRENSSSKHQPATDGQLPIDSHYDNYYNSPQPFGFGPTGAPPPMAHPTFHDAVTNGTPKSEADRFAQFIPAERAAQASRQYTPHDTNEDTDFPDWLDQRMRKTMRKAREDAVPKPEFELDY